MHSMPAMEDGGKQTWYTLRISYDLPMEGWMNLQFAGVFWSPEWRHYWGVLDP